MRLRWVLLAATASVGAGLMLAGPASAANLHCGQTLNSSVTLIGNLDCSSTAGAAILIGHDGVTLNLNGYKITGYAHDDVIDVDGHNSFTVKGGELDVTNFLAIGIFNSGGNNLVVAGVKIVGNDLPDSIGVDSENSSGLSVTGSSISGVDTGVLLEYETGALVKGNTIAPDDYDSGAAVDDAYGTGDMVVSNTMNGPAGGDGLYAYYSAGTLFSGNTVTGYVWGVYTYEYDAGITVTGNVLDGNEYGVYFQEYDSGDVVSGNYVKNSVYDGIYDEYSFNNTYTGNVLTSNGATANTAGYYIYPDGYGPVTMVNNYARTGNGYGFWTEDAYNASVPGGPYSLFSGNVATANGSNGDAGFWDEYSVGATWSKNVANSNNDDGFYFFEPWRETITGNAATMNGGDGFYFRNTGPDHQPLAVTNNSATYNGGFGFNVGNQENTSYPVAGSGNTGGGTNASGDCYLISGCS